MKSALINVGKHAWLLGPLAVCGSTTLLVIHATGKPISLAGNILFIAGVIAAYAVDHWADQPPSQRSRHFLWLAGLAAGTGVLAASQLPVWKFGMAAALGCVGLAYRQLKKWPLSKTLLIAGGWTVASVCFPVEGKLPELLLTPLSGVLLALFAADALLCDFKDGLTDARAGVRTAVVLWGPRVAALVAGGLAVGGVFAALTVGRNGLAAAGLALAGLAASPRLVSRPVLGPALVDGALALPAVLILLGWV